MAKILVVEDNPANMKLTTMLLHSAGHSVLSAVDAETGLRLSRGEPPDLILLDVMTPGLDGRQVARALKADHATSRIPIIMVTAQTSREARLAALDAGAEDFL